MPRRLRSRLPYARLVDLLSGLLFLALGIAGIALSGTYRLGTPGNMGPGYFPLMVSICLATIGLLVTLNVGSGEAPERREIALRGPLVVLGSIVVFALTLDRLGLVAASFLLVVGCRFAVPRASLVEGAALGAGLAAVATFAFAYGLGLPFPVWPVLP